MHDAEEDSSDSADSGSASEASESQLVKNEQQNQEPAPHADADDASGGAESDKSKQEKKTKTKPKLDLNAPAANPRPPGVSRKRTSDPNEKKAPKTKKPRHSSVKASTEALIKHFEEQVPCVSLGSSYIVARCLHVQEKDRAAQLEVERQEEVKRREHTQSQNKEMCDAINRLSNVIEKASSPASASVPAPGPAAQPVPPPACTAEDLLRSISSLSQTEREKLGKLLSGKSQ